MGYAPNRFPRINPVRRFKSEKSFKERRGEEKGDERREEKRGFRGRGEGEGRGGGA